MLKIFKFGGASLKDAQSIKNVVNILKYTNYSPLLIVVSAIGKTTNKLEEIWKNILNDKKKTAKQLINNLYNEHINIIRELEIENKISNELKKFFSIKINKHEYRIKNKNYIYDNIVHRGELASSLILSRYLNNNKIKNKFIDIREIIITDNNFKNASVNWELTLQNCKEKLLPLINNNILITQGFIASNGDKETTTLGREGSDFSASILAYALNAKEITLWKDVPGIMNADPKKFKNAVKLNKISYKEAVELAFYGAKVLHPKTIKPLQNKNIPLLIKSFNNFKENGTYVDNNTSEDAKFPSFIIKEKQTLISISSKDFSFIVEKNIAHIFNKVNKYYLKINLMQNSAVSFSMCVENENKRLKEFINDLQKDYNVLYNKNVNLITIRHYTDYLIKKLIKNKKILLEQRTRNTIQLVVI